MNIKNKKTKLYTLSAVIIGFFLTDDLTPNEQNALGNWLMLIGQMLATNAYFEQVQNERKNKALSDKDTKSLLNKMLKNIERGLDEINKM